MQPRKTGPFPYIPITERPPLKWPNGARIAVWVIPNIEFFALDEKVIPYQTIVPDVPMFAARDYGARVGVWRQMEVLEKHNIKATVALNSDVCDMYPQIVKTANDLGWEFMGHSESNTRRQDTMPLEEERRVIATVKSKIEAATGVPPIGWMGAGLKESWNTLDLLVEADFQYVADWINDDQPYLMDINGKRLVSIPYGSDTGDKLIETKGYTTEEWGHELRRKFDVLYREGADSGRAMGVSLHPYITGTASRIDELDKVLTYFREHDDVWFATGKEIVRAYLETGVGEGRQVS